MPPLDWRDLYAANRAEIERHLGSPTRAAREPRRRVKHATGSGEPRAHVHGGLRYVVHAPPTTSPQTPVPLVMVLHGCTQDAASIAAGTLINDVADRAGFVAVYPEQSRGANPQGCWNWFASAHQSRGRGEPAALAAVLRSVAAGAPGWSIDPARVFVAGMSAGGAMAGVMAVTYPDLVTAVAIHSGLAYGAATGQASAFAAMSGAGREPAHLGEVAAGAMSSAARPVPAIVIHGSEDRVVAPVNGDRVVRQWMATNRLLAAGEYVPDFERPTSVARGRAAGGHHHSCSRWLDRRGRLMQEYVRVQGLGHAWSGGTAGGSYTDPRGPSASELIWRFFDTLGTSAT